MASTTPQWTTSPWWPSSASSRKLAIGSHYQQDVDLQNLFKDVAGAFVQTATDPAQVRHLIDRAFRIALEERTVTCVIDPAICNGKTPCLSRPTCTPRCIPAVGWTPPRVVPHQENLRRAVDVLNAGSKVAILVGAGALCATDEVIAVADVLGAGVAKALLGKAAVPDDLPFVTGSLGWLGTRASNEMLAECDTLLMVGSGFPYTEFLPREGQARGVQIDLDGGMLNLRYPMEVGLIGDSAETLRALQPLLVHQQDRSMAGSRRRESTGLAQRSGAPRHARGKPTQSATGVLGVVAPPS